MPRYLALSSLALAAVTAGLVATTPASADGAQTLCPFSGAQVLPDGSLQMAIEANGAGCVVVNTDSAGVGLDDVILAPGWSSQVKRDDNRRVEVRFTESATGDRVEARAEPGKTEVK